MAKHHFRTRAELERQMDAARQLRAETLAGCGWMIAGLLGLVLVVRRLIDRSATRTARRA